MLAHCRLKTNGDERRTRMSQSRERAILTIGVVVIVVERTD